MLNNQGPHTSRLTVSERHPTITCSTFARHVSAPEYADSTAAKSRCSWKKLQEITKRRCEKTSAFDSRLSGLRCRLMSSTSWQ